MPCGIVRRTAAEIKPSSISASVPLRQRTTSCGMWTAPLDQRVHYSGTDGTERRRAASSGAVSRGRALCKRPLRMGQTAMQMANESINSSNWCARTKRKMLTINPPLP